MDKWRGFVVGGAVSGACLALIGGVVLAGGRPLSTDLSGAEEAPPADVDAIGQADLTINQGTGEVCSDLSWANVDGTVVAAHIHHAPVGVNGPIVVPLSVAGDGSSASACAIVTNTALLKDIRKNPTEYYVNVHSVPDFPGGAIRGQLGD